MLVVKGRIGEVEAQCLSEEICDLTIDNVTGVRVPDDLTPIAQKLTLLRPGSRQKIDQLLTPFKCPNKITSLQVNKEGYAHAFTTRGEINPKI